MEIKKSVLNTIIIFVVAGCFLFIAFIMFSSSGKAPESEQPNPIKIEGDTQIIDVTAKGGYSPHVITAKADTKTILRVETKNTFDCSSAFAIPKLGIQKFLPPTAKTDFDLGIQKSGSEIDATCTMGMYTFKIKFK